MNFDIKDNSKEVIKAMKQQALKAMEECGLVAEGHAKLNVRNQVGKGQYVPTGALMNSISHKVVEESKEIACYIGTNMEYAPYVELGTGIYYDGGGRRTSWVYKDREGKFHMTNGQRAKPYLKPAVTEHIDEYKKIIKQELKG